MASVIKIESFDKDVGASGSTHGLTNDVGDLSDAFVKLVGPIDKQSGGPTGSTANSNPNTVCCGVQMTGTSQLTFYKNTSTSVKVTGEVWRYTGAANGPDEFIVRGRYAISMSGATASQAVSGIVNTDKCVPFVQGMNNPNTSVNDYDASTVACWIDGSDNIQLERGSTTGTLTVYVVVVEFTGSNWTIGHGVSSSHDTSNDTITLNTDSTGTGGSTFDVSNWENAIIEGNLEGDTAETGLSDNLGAWYPATSTTQAIFRLQQDASARNDGKAYCHVMVNGGITNKRASNTNISEGNGTYGTATWPAGASTSESIDELALEWFSDTSGVGTAHARGRLVARITAASGTIQHWVHRSGNNVSVHYGVINFSGVDGTVKPIILTVSVETIPLGGSSNIVVTGSNFGTDTGSADVEISDNPIYGSGTIVSQSLDSRADTTLQFDTVLTGISTDQTIYLWITDSAGVTSGGWSLFYGNPDFITIVTTQLSTTPDHAWFWNNNLDDSLGANDHSIRIGSPSLAAVPGVRGTTHSGYLSASGQGWDCADSNFMNLAAFTARQVFYVIRFDSVNQAVAAFDEEGGSVNNLVMIANPGNVITAQLADTGDDNVHAYSSFKLTPNRWYLVWQEFDYNEGSPTYRLGIDREIQPDSFGNPLTATDHDSHSGNIAVGTPETSDEVFGTDVSFPNVFPFRIQAKISLRTVLPLSEVRSKLFDQGMLSDITISSDTEANMQTAIEAYNNTTRADAPICIEIEPCDDGDFTLTPTGIKFDEGASVHIRYIGGDTLTYVNSGGGDASKVIAPYGGTINIEETIVTTIQGIPSGVEWHLYEKSLIPGIIGTVELDGEETKPDSNDVLYSDRYNADTDVVLQIIEDGVEEELIEFSLKAQPQIIIVNLTTETNI